MHYLFILIAAVLWGLSGVVTKGALEAGVGVLELAFWRTALGGVLFCLHAAKRKELRLEAPGDIWRLLTFALFIIVTHYITFNLAVERGGVSLVNLFLASVPALVALAAWAFFRESLTVLKLSLVVLSCMGLLLITKGSGEGVMISPSSLCLSLIVALTVAAYPVASKGLLKRYSPIALSAYALECANAFSFRRL